MQEVVIKNQMGKFLGMYGWGVRDNAIFFPDASTAAAYAAQKAKGIVVTIESARAERQTEASLPDYNPFSVGRRG